MVLPLACISSSLCGSGSLCMSSVVLLCDEAGTCVCEQIISHDSLYSLCHNL